MSGFSIETTTAPILVTGAGGFVGRRLVAVLRQHGQQVEVVSSNSAGMVDATRGTVRTDAAWPVRVSAVVFLAQSPHYRNPDGHLSHLLRVNQCLAVEVAERALRAGARRFIYASTGSVYSASFQPLSELSPVCRTDAYALSKLHAEESLSLLRARIPTTALRLFGVYGPGQTGKLVPNLMCRLRRGESVTLDRNPHDSTDTDGLRLSLTYVDDVVAVIRRVLEQGGPPVLNVAHRDPTSIRGLSDALAAHLGSCVRFVDSGRERAGDLVADTSVLDDLGFACDTPLAAGLARTLAEQ